MIVLQVYLKVYPRYLYTWSNNFNIHKFYNSYYFFVSTCLAQFLNFALIPFVTSPRPSFLPIQHKLKYSLLYAPDITLKKISYWINFKFTLLSGIKFLFSNYKQPWEYKNFHENFWAWPPLFAVHLVDLYIYIYIY